MSLMRAYLKLKTVKNIASGSLKLMLPLVNVIHVYKVLRGVIYFYAYAISRFFWP